MANRKHKRKPPEDFAQRLGHEVARRRVARGMTQEHLAGRVDVDPTHLAKIEGGERKPSLDLLYSLAAELDAQAWELLHFDNQPAKLQRSEREREWIVLRGMFEHASTGDVRLLTEIARKVWRE